MMTARRTWAWGRLAVLVLAAVACDSSESEKRSAAEGAPATPASRAASAAAVFDSSQPVSFDGRIASLPGFDVPWDTTRSPREIVRIDSLRFPQLAGSAASRLVFTDSSTLLIPVRDAALVGRLDGEGSRRWFLLSGYVCSDCDAPITVFTVRSSTGAYPGIPRGLPFPGAQSDLGSEKPFYRGRLFLGRCASTDATLALWLEEMIEETDAEPAPADSAPRWMRRARLLFAREALVDSIADWTPAIESAAESAVRDGRCIEVKPVDR